MENPIPQVIAVLSTTAARWDALTGNLPSDLLAKRPVESEWSAVECLQHLVDVENVFQHRLDCFLQGKDFPAFYPDADGSPAGAETPTALAGRFADLRRQTLERLDRLTPIDLERRARHQELGMVTLGELLHEWAAHDLNHLMQAERALMQPLIAGCGPWSVYFSDHRFTP